MKPDISNREEENMTSKNWNEVSRRVIKLIWWLYTVALKCWYDIICFRSLSVLIWSGLISQSFLIKLVSLPHYQRTLSKSKLKENWLLYKINILYTIANDILSNLKRKRSTSKITWDLRNKDKISVCNCYLKKRKFILECILHRITL